MLLLCHPAVVLCAISNIENMAQSVALCAVLALALAGSAAAYPIYWADEYAPTCFAVPKAGKDCHKAPQTDRTTGIMLYPAGQSSGKPVAKACAGKAYNVMVTFPDRRLAYVALGAGSRVTTSAAAVKRCANSAVFSTSNGFKPSSRFTASGVAPMAVGSKWQVQVVSATGGCAPFMVASASIDIAKC